MKLQQVMDHNRPPTRQGQHSREVFLLCDMILVTKIVKRKNNITNYQLRKRIDLENIKVSLFETADYNFGFSLEYENEAEPIMLFNALTNDDRERFTHDLKEAITEVKLYNKIQELKKLRKSSKSQEIRMIPASAYLSNNFVNPATGHPNLGAITGLTPLNIGTQPHPTMLSVSQPHESHPSYQAHLQNHNNPRMQRTQSNDINPDFSSPMAEVEHLAHFHQRQGILTRDSNPLHLQFDEQDLISQKNTASDYEISLHDENNNQTHLSNDEILRELQHQHNILTQMSLKRRKENSDSTGRDMDELSNMMAVDNNGNRLSMMPESRSSMKIKNSRLTDS